MFTKKQQFLKPEDWVMFKDETGEIVPAIVSEELWDKANEVLARRSKDVKQRQGKCNHGNLLTGKLFCEDCGKTYYRRDSKDRNGKKNSKWVCSGKIKNGAESCLSFPIYESEITPILLDVFRESSPDIEELIEQYMEMFKTINQPEQLQKTLEELKKKRELEQKKKSKLLTYNANGDITDEDFLSMSKEITKNIKDIDDEIIALESDISSKGDFKKRIDEMRNMLKQASLDAESGIINNSFVEKYIDKIFVKPIDEHKMELKIRLFTEETTTKYLEKLTLRTGHTSKKMIESYENSMK